MNIRIENKEAGFAVEYRITPENALIYNTTDVSAKFNPIRVAINKFLKMLYAPKPYILSRNVNTHIYI